MPNTPDISPSGPGIRSEYHIQRDRVPRACTPYDTTDHAVRTAMTFGPSGRYRAGVVEGSPPFVARQKCRAWFQRVAASHARSSRTVSRCTWTVAAHGSRTVCGGSDQRRRTRLSEIQDTRHWSEPDNEKHAGNSRTTREELRSPGSANHREARPARRLRQSGQHRPNRESSLHLARWRLQATALASKTQGNKDRRDAGHCHMRYRGCPRAGLH